MFVIVLFLASENVQLSDKQYSFQHVKAFGAKNLLIGDPWDQTSTYYIDTRWKIMRFSVDSVTINVFSNLSF